MMSSEKTNNSRRDFLVKSMALIPTVVIGGAGAGAIGVATSATAQAARCLSPASGNTAAASDWKPQFFNDREWAFINAAVARLIPADELPVPAPKRPASRSLSTASLITLTPPAPSGMYAGALQPRRAERDGLSAAAGA